MRIHSQVVLTTSLMARAGKVKCTLHHSTERLLGIHTYIHTYLSFLLMYTLHLSSNYQQTIKFYGLNCLNAQISTS